MNKHYLSVSLYRIPTNPPAILGIIIAVIVVNQPQFVISVFAGKPERIVLCGIPFHPENIPIRAVFVQGAASRSDAEKRRGVFQQVVREYRFSAQVPVSSKRLMARMRVAAGSSRSHR